MIGVTCVFILITGICYSCAYNGNNSSAVVTTLTGEEEQEYGKMIKVDSESSQKSEDETNAKTQKTDDSLQSVSSNGTRQQDIRSEAMVNEDKASSPSNSDIFVHVCGAVIKPGVYQVSIDARVIELIELAGGLGADAAGDYINQAQQVTDGQRIYIPTTEEIKDLTSKETIIDNMSVIADNNSKSQLININTASAEELMELPGIGEAKASSIIEYRTQNGSFTATSDLMKIPGIKEGLFNKVSQYIMVE